MTTSQEAAIKKAEALFAAVSAGKTLFSRTAGDTWTIVGPAADLITYSDVTVTKRDGTTETVRVSDILGTYTARGLSYRVAHFKRPKTTPAPVKTVATTPSHGAGIGSPAMGLYLATPTTRRGGCYFCGVPDCTDCG